MLVKHYIWTDIEMNIIVLSRVEGKTLVLGIFTDEMTSMIGFQVKTDKHWSLFVTHLTTLHVLLSPETIQEIIDLQQALRLPDIFIFHQRVADFHIVTY